MPIHSIISEDDIFAGYQYPAPEVVNVKGGKVLRVKVNGEYKVQRLISTDPFMYLKSEYQPTRFYF